MNIRPFLIPALSLACLLPCAAANVNYSFTGVGSDGRTVTFQLSAAAPIASSAVLPATQVSCAPVCDDIAIFPNSQLGYDLLIFDLRNGAGPPTAYAFYFPPGAFANPGFYSTVNVQGAQTSGSLTVQQNGVPAINSPSLLPNGATLAAYGVAFNTSGGTPPYTFSVDPSTALPAGLTLSAGGVLAGTPAAAGEYTFTVRVTDAASISSTRTYSLNIGAGLNIATASLPGGAVGSLYGQVLAAAGGTGPYTWSLAAGSLPAGLALAPGGILTGTLLAGGAFTFTLQVTDAAANTASRSFTVNIASVVSIVTTSPLPNIPANVPLNLALSAVGGAPPYTWTLVSGSLPAGLALNPFGALTGTPLTASNSAFTLQVSDSAGGGASRFFTLAVTPGIAIANSSPLPAGITGSAYSFTFTGTGGTAPYAWAITSGAPPAGLSLSTSGVLSGTPSQSGSFTFVLSLADAAAGNNIGIFSLQVLPAVSITTPPILPAAAPSTSYSQTLSATGGAGNFTWTVVSGALPPGLTLSPAGALTGIPATGGVFNFVARATDSTGGSSLQSFNLAVGNALVINTAAQLPNASIGVQYALTLSASGGLPPYVWMTTGGTVPPGLALSTAGVFSGTPSSAGTFTFDIRVTGANAVSAIRTFSLTVGAGLAITSSPALPGGVPGVAYSQTLQADGGTPPYAWTVTGGSLPPGLSLSPAGILSGTPSSSGNFTFQARVTDSTTANATQAFTLNIGNNLTIISSTSLPPAVVSQAYTFTFGAAGGTPPYSWAFAAGSIPPGLSLAPNGALSGTPSAQGAFLFTVRVTDAAATAVIQNFSLTVNTGLTITSAPALAPGSVGLPYSQPLAAAGGVPPYSWSLFSGSLPPGLLLAANGTLAGTPTAAGNFAFSVIVADSSSASATANFTLTISGGVTITTASLPNAAVGAAYSQTLAASGGAPPYVWSLQAGSLPPGLLLSQNGSLTGSPVTPGLFSFTIRVTDSGAVSNDKDFQITVNAAITIVTASPLPNGSFNTPYFQTLQATGGVAPYTWAVVSGSLPPGLTLASNGALSGAATLGGAFSFVAEVTDAASVKATKAFALAITTAITITTPSSLPEATAGVSYFLAFGASGGTGPYTWSVLSGALPPGMNLSAAGALTGTPAAAGSFNFVLRIADAAQVASQAPFSLTVSSGATLPRAGIIAQIASGGTWKTAITLVNPNTAQSQVRVSFFGGDGALLALPLAITQGGVQVSAAGAVVERTIPPNGTLLIETDAAAFTTAVGWADVRASLPVSGFAIFRQKHGSGVDSEGTSPLENRLQQSFLQPMDNQIGFSTGVALVNLSADQEATITAVKYDDNGAETGRENFLLPPNGHTSFSLPARFPDLAGRRGIIEFQSNRPAGITGLGLRFQPTLSFTSVPIILR